MLRKDTKLMIGIPVAFILMGLLGSLIIRNLNIDMIDSGANPYPNITLPVHSKAIKPQHEIDRPIEGAKSVFYKVNIPFPAKDLTAFYDDEIKKMGYIPFTGDGTAKFYWDNFNEKSGEWEPTSSVPARYVASWVDEQKKIRINLMIRYQYDGMNKDWVNNALVSCNFYKFVDIRDIKDAHNNRVQ